MLLEPLQVRQLEGHGVHRAPEVMISVKTPEEGHWDTQLPLCRNGVSGDVQLTQLELPGPLHVPHAALQGWQTELPSAYLPIGRHEARHEPGELKKGCDEAHVEHWVADGPVHVAQEEWHRWHVSGDVRLPPAHVKPASMAHVWLQPSNVSWLPSSHSSVPTRLPSPQTDWHVSFEVRLPPEHAKPVSMVQLALHPSPLRVLLSSHSSVAIQTIRLPSPHNGRHVSRPPMPEPPATSVVEEHVKPTSILQSALHPSPPCVLPSSQSSAVLRIPLPQM